MAKPLSTLIFRSEFMAFSTSTAKSTLSLSLLRSKPRPLFSLSRKLLSTTSTPFPLQYDLIVNRPSPPPPAPSRRRASKPQSDNSPEMGPTQDPDSKLGLDSWVDKKLAGEVAMMDKSKRKYYRKRRKRMYGSDSDDEESNRKNEDGFVELKPEVVEFPRLHKREEELYFYDAFAYPWDKDKHYKMVYQLEKKYFPDQCLDKAFLDPKDSKFDQDGKGMRSNVSKKGERGEEDKKFVFFEGKEEEEGVTSSAKDVTERKVREFFTGLKRGHNKDNEVEVAEPYLVARSAQLPPRWDGPHGTVVLVNKPKGDL